MKVFCGWKGGWPFSCGVGHVRHAGVHLGRDPGARLHPQLFVSFARPVFWGCNRRKLTAREEQPAWFDYDVCDDRAAGPRLISSIIVAAGFVNDIVRARG
eukprot:7334814-Lingulodinium_polyedra.AAC.1